MCFAVCRMRLACRRLSHDAATASPPPPSREGGGAPRRRARESGGVARDRTMPFGHAPPLATRRGAACMSLLRDARALA